MDSQSQIRRRMRAARRRLTPAQVRAASEAVAHQLAIHPLYRRSRHIACYWPVAGELDPMPLVERAWADHKQCYLPVLARYPRSHLWFAPFGPHATLVNNRFGIPEPAGALQHRASAQRLDLVLTPLVAFDEQGHRIGMGGGYYDRTFAFLRYRHHWHRPRLVGIAYQFQKVSTIAAQPWDVPLHAVVTEAGVCQVRDA